MSVIFAGGSTLRLWCGFLLAIVTLLTYLCPQEMLSHLDSLLTGAPSPDEKVDEEEALREFEDAD